MYKPGYTNNNFNQLGPVTILPPAPVPSADLYKEQHWAPSKAQRTVDRLNANRDLNTSHDFDFWLAKDQQLRSYSTFTGIANKVLENRAKNSSFLGGIGDFEGLDQKDIDYFYNFIGDPDNEEFLGINFKALGNDIKRATKWVGHGIGSIATDVGHAARWAGKETWGLATDVGHGLRWMGKETISGVTAPFRAAEWLINGAEGVLAGALGGQQATDLGGGGGGFGGGDMAGAGMAPLDDNDTGDGLTPQALAQRVAQEQNQQDMAAVTEASAHKRKLLIYGGIALVAVIGIIYFIKRK